VRMLFNKFDGKKLVSATTINKAGKRERKK
jgi:hypothetical protein